ncbi:hypothetical protein ACOMHN_050425 [Nucella lapillus]
MSLSTERKDGVRPCYLNESFVMYSTNDTVTMTLDSLSLNREMSYVSIRVQFSAVNQSERTPALELIYLTSSRGYVQTHGWEKTTGSPPHINSCVTLTPPAGLGMFYSFVGLHTGINHYLGVSRYHCDSSDSPFKALEVNTIPSWGSFVPPNYSERTKAKYFSCKFKSDRNFLQSSGFRVMFSFHPNSSQPVRVRTAAASGQHPAWLWNCSQSAWPHLLEHFVCDLLPQCLESEDEAPCPYTTETCGLGKIEAVGRCYSFHFSFIPWSDAVKTCRDLGESLVSLESAREMRAVIQLVRQVPHMEFLWLGLRLTSRTNGKASLYDM